MSKKAETDWILTYYQQIQNGTANVGRWIRDWYALIVDGLQQKRFFYDVKAANKVILIDGGNIVEQGAPQQFFTRPSTERARQFLSLLEQEQERPAKEGERKGDGV